MRNIWIIAKRDYKTYFSSPVAYVVSFMFLGIMGYMFIAGLGHFNLQNRQYQSFNMGHAVSITDGVVRPLFGNMNVILMMMLPLVTMRLFAEEKKNHTIELLMTSPVSLTEIILGKFLSSLLLVISLLAVTIVYPITLALAGKPDWGPILSSYLGTVLMTSCYLSVGVLFSALTENQIIAAAMTWGLILFFWLISWFSQLVGPVWGELLNYLSLISHFNNFGIGLISSSDVVFFLSFTGIGLFLTHRVLDSYRWR